LRFYYGQIDRGQFKQCVHSDIKTYLDGHKVSTIADDNALTHIFMKIKSVPNFNSYIQNMSPSYNHFDKPNLGF